MKLILSIMGFCSCLIRLSVIGALLPSFAYSVERVVSGPTGVDDTIIEKTVEVVDTTQALVSDQILYLSDQVDSFFASDRLDKEAQRSQVKYSQGIIFPEVGRPILQPNVNAQFILPNTQKRLNLVVEELRKDTLSATDDGSEGTISTTEGTQRDYAASLRYFFVNSKEWNISTESGIKLVYPPDPFARIRGRRRWDLGAWESRFTITSSWFNSRGFGHIESLDFDRPLTDSLLFRVTNSLSWTQTDRYFNTLHLLGLFHKLSERDGLSYLLFATGSSDPIWQLNSYNASIVYRRRLYKKWLFFNVQPLISWPRSDRFDPDHSITFRIEMIFGST